MENDICYLDERKSFSIDKFSKLKNRLSSSESLLNDNACVYATGSFGRLEASKTSDIDLFIVSDQKDKSKPAFSNLNSILLRADLISATRECEFPDFDSDGKFLVAHELSSFLKNLGSPEDDAKNTLTGRLLLFLESKPLLGDKHYQQIIEDVVAEYFVDFSKRPNSFVPTFLTNDILRLWRTFCLNYEYGRRKDRSKPHTASSESEKIEINRKKAKIKNYKLKHSRMLTCYSAIIYMLQKHSQFKTVTMSDALEMVALTPLERINAAALSTDDKECLQLSSKIHDTYAKFLEVSARCDDEIIQEITRKDSEAQRNPYNFGDQIFSLIKAIEPNDTMMKRVIAV